MSITRESKFSGKGKGAERQEGSGAPPPSSWSRRLDREWLALNLKHHLFLCGGCGSTCRCELANGIRESGVNSDRDADFPRLAEVSESLDYSIARIPGLGVATGKDPKVDEGGRVGGKGILPVEPSQADGLNHSDIYNHSWRLLSPEWL